MGGGGGVRNKKFEIFLILRHCRKIINEMIEIKILIHKEVYYDRVLIR